jgi:[acyl-carrier-protein] S-malonyltransferase
VTVVLMLPGQGSQYRAMGAFLYDSQARFRTAMDDFFDAYGEGSTELVRLWHEGSRAQLAHGCIAQPLLFAVTYATARTLLDPHPLLPVVLLGHSVGELAAATVAGVFDLALAAAVLRERADLLRQAPPGGLVGCRAEPQEVRRRLRTAGLDAVIAADNAPGQCVVSGGQEELEQVVRVLREGGVACMRVPATEPFHSPLLAPAARRLGDFLAQRADRLRAPRRPLLSAFSGGWVGAKEATDPYFWTRQMAEPVRFRQALRQLDAPATLYLEAGPGTTLAMAATTLGPVATGAARVLSTMPTAGSAPASWLSATEALSRHATAG